MRKDLGMRKGKMIAQGAHASMMFLVKGAEAQRSFFHDDIKLKKSITVEQDRLLTGKFTKICVSVDSEEEMQAIHDAAIAVGIESHMVTDAGLTEFDGVPTKTCIALGPDYSSRIDQLTGHLKLL